MNLRLADVSKRYGAGAAVDRVVPAPRGEGERLRRCEWPVAIESSKLFALAPQSGERVRERGPLP